MFKWWFKGDKKNASDARDDMPAQSRRLPDSTDEAFHDPRSLKITIALQHHQAGRLAEAQAAYHDVLAAEPGNFDALHLSGVIAFQMGHHEIAAERISRALSQDPANAAALNNLGAVFRAQGRLDDALGCFDKALALRPDYADARTNLFDAHFHLGNVLRESGRFEAAGAHFGKALALRPESAAANINLGNVLSDQGKGGEAIGYYERAIALDPGIAEAHLNLANAFKAQYRLEAAIASYRRTIALRPEWFEAHYGLGNALKDAGRSEEAVLHYRHALSVRDDFAEGHYALGNALKDRDDLEGMRDCYRKALALKPDYVEARWALAMCQIPAVYELEADPERVRANFSQELHELDCWFNERRLSDGFKAVGSMQPFLLAYQEQDNRGLLQSYGDLCARIMSAWSERQRLPRAEHRQLGTPIRVGVVSQHFFNHSVWNAIVKGWFERLDPDRFSLHAFYLGTRRDEETRFALAHAAHFESGHQELRQWVEAILGQELDVLIYPEIGMDPMTARLASLRLAPVQAASWGHPETTGLPTIDYYISAECLEPAEAQGNYTERLIALPNLGCFYRAVPVSPVVPVLHDFGLEPSTPIFICPGVPFKYAPEHDHVLTEIARRLGRCRFVFFTHRLSRLSEKVRKRLERAFARDGLDADRFVTFIPWQNSPEFHGWLRCADVLLDTIGFSGFNTAIQGVQCGIPVVTKEGRFMRGRLASGILNRMGLQELVARSEAEYIERAVQLAKDASYRGNVRDRIEKSRPILFEDVTAIRALEDFLIEATARHRSTGATRRRPCDEHT